MTKTYKPFTEETLDDALAVIRERFPPSAIDIAKKVLANPLRKLCPDAGTIGYRDGRPVCFQATMLRRLYYGKKEIFGQVGGLTCKVLKGCPLSVMLETLERSAYPRYTEQLWFGNSCCAATAGLDETRGGGVGPASFSYTSWRPVRLFSCLAYILRRKILKAKMPNWAPFDTRESGNYQHRTGAYLISREMSFSEEFSDKLMSRYLETNAGIVCSRTAKELSWMFGDRLRTGQTVFLTLRKGVEPLGHILIGSDESARRWRIMDWFALDNDLSYLQLLLAGACRFLRKQTPCIIFESRGFPDFVQPILRSYMRYTLQRGVNFFSWNCQEKVLTGALNSMASDDNWFYGPYDGDLVM